MGSWAGIMRAVSITIFSSVHARSALVLNRKRHEDPLSHASATILFVLPPIPQHFLARIGRSAVF